MSTIDEIERSIAFQTPTSEKRLKNCPFCDGEAESGGYESCDCCGKPFNGAVWCVKCGVAIDHQDTVAEAEEKWNKRS